MNFHDLRPPSAEVLLLRGKVNDLINEHDSVLEELESLVGAIPSMEVSVLTKELYDAYMRATAFLAAKRRV